MATHDCSGGDSAFDEVFAALCRRYDGPEWDTDLLQVAIETEIAEEAETSIHTIRVALEAEIKGRDVVIPEFVPIKEPPLSNNRNDSDERSVVSAMNSRTHLLASDRRRRVGLAVLLLLGSDTFAVTKGPTEDSLWYYEIGGAEPVSAPANPAVTSVTLGGSAQLGMGYSCGKFDPVAAVTNTLNDIGAGVDSMMTAMTVAASAAIAALPALILQRANPGLYDLFQNALLQAKETMQLATKSCEQMEAEIAKGKNPYADLITLSKGNDWKLQMGIGGNDAVTAKTAVETSNGNNGVPWIGGQAGGSGQPVLEFTGDIVKAGYNLTMNRPVTTAGPVPPAAATRLSEIWVTPTEARDWVVEVVGENIVTTCDTCRKDSIPGTGLLPKLHQEATVVTLELQNLVGGAIPPTLDNLDRITAPGVAITSPCGWTRTLSGPCTRM